MIEYGSILIFFGASAAVAALLLGLTMLLGPKRPNPVKAQPFECGRAPLSLPGGRFPVKFYIMAMLFIVLDVELVFLFPWAVVFKQVGVVGFVSMLLFLFVVALGYLYAWRKGALEWE